MKIKMLDNFAKVFNTDKGQILFFTEYSEEEDKTMLHQMMQTEHFTVDMVLGYEGHEQGKNAQNALDILDQPAAEIVANSIYKIITEGTK